MKDKKADFDKLNEQVEELKSSNATAEEWKSKFETLQNEVKEKEKQAQAEKELAEKRESISNRFVSALGDKKFSHDAIKQDYLKKFSDALESKDYEGKSDADIFHDLTKDDAGAFAGVTPVRLAGGNTINGGTDDVKPIPKIF